MTRREAVHFPPPNQRQTICPKSAELQLPGPAVLGLRTGHLSIRTGWGGKRHTWHGRFLPMAVLVTRNVFWGSSPGWVRLSLQSCFQTQQLSSVTWSSLSSNLPFRAAFMLTAQLFPTSLTNVLFSPFLGGEKGPLLFFVPFQKLSFSHTSEKKKSSFILKTKNSPSSP
jgi:hypothetical protein